MFLLEARRSVPPANRVAGVGLDDTSGCTKLSLGPMPNAWPWAREGTRRPSNRIPAETSTRRTRMMWAPRLLCRSIGARTLQGYDVSMSTGTSIPTAARVSGFSYAIRNIVAEARKLEAAGRKVTYLNIGDPVPFGFRTPPHLIA